MTQSWLFHACFRGSSRGPEAAPEPIEEEPAAPVDEPPRLQAVPEPTPAPAAEGALMAKVIAANQKGGVAEDHDQAN